MEREIIQSELRRGNFVIGYSKEVERTESVFVDSELAGSYPVVSFMDKTYCTDVGFLTPIKITEEWLRKFGFNIKEEWKSNMGSNFYREDRKVEVSISPVHKIQIRIKDSYKPSYMIEYVHELQNIYKELTGEELPYEEETTNKV